MAAEVSMSRVVEYLKKKDDDKPQPVPLLMLHHHQHHSKESTPPMTRDLLGLEFQSSQELVDLDLHVPSGWEKRLDLKSGKVYLQKCSSQGRPSASNHKHQPINSAPPQFQDLNFPPSPSKLASNNGSDDAFLDLKLLTSSSPSKSCNYQSVCTLDKVKSALERANGELAKKRSLFWKSSSSPLYSLTSSSIKETREEDSNQEMSTIAAGCPSCLLYVLISKDNPKCPRCNSVVPLPSSKKPRIDLNISI
ncbi:hypothetical protein BT93_F1558 [Corymbia citriodora subsp. variegata]|nr:hypothetical protein BT93_F1558 [Corymbia citriodora subsp. variegata]KAF8024406.1 hypothetical protein BT93_F1558 [Corymbia citriodora subsp. variegata]